MVDGAVTLDQLHGLISNFLVDHPAAQTNQLDFRRARYDAGLAWVDFPSGLGGLGLPRDYQHVVDGELRNAGAVDQAPPGISIIAPTILGYGTEEQKGRFLRRLWTGEDSWCQLFSEPEAGSDLAAVRTGAVRHGREWVVDGQKVWTSNAQNADYGILLARTDPAVPKHAGLTFFICDMNDPGVQVRPLRQLTGEAEFNEVFLNDVRIPDEYRVGAPGQGWRIATATLNNERTAIGGSIAPREGGMIGVVAQSWRESPQLRTPDLFARLMALWVEAEAARLSGVQARQKLIRRQSGIEAAVLKFTFAQLNQRLSSLEVELLGEAGLRYTSWSDAHQPAFDMNGRDAGYRYLRAKGNSIEGGTSEVLLNLIAERVLGLPPEPKVAPQVSKQ